MPAFEESKAYVAQESTTFFNDGREEELVKFVTERPACRGSPAKVLQAIDEFGRTRKYLMNVGDDKGRIVVEEIRRVQPEIMVELGGYCGYSTILFADAMRQAREGNGGGEQRRRYFSLERDPGFAANIRTLVAYAGLDDTVEVITGSSDAGLKTLHGERGVTRIDLMFLDHYKPAYTTDLKLCESLGLIRPGSVLAADNVISPGNPPYLKYVRASVQEKRAALRHGPAETSPQHADTHNFPGRASDQYGAVEELSSEVKGDPNLVYESRLHESFEPTGEPVSGGVRDEAHMLM